MKYVVSITDIDPTSHEWLDNPTASFIELKGLDEDEFQQIIKIAAWRGKYILVSCKCEGEIL